MPQPPSIAELTQFGIRLEDDGPHPYDPAVEWWNESWFWDWFDEAGNVAGHCRLGFHPVQQRAWLWLMSYREGEWIVLEEPRLPLRGWRLENLAHESFGLSFSWRVDEPLVRGRLQVGGFGRVVSGPRAGMVLPVGVDLDVRGVGPAHSLGRATAAGHAATEAYDACRFEQPIIADGTIDHGGEAIAFSGRGERDHSWGPRLWNLEWIFLAVSNDTMRLQCAEARVPNAGTFGVGYLHRETTASIFEVEFDFRFDDDSLRAPLAGGFRVAAEDGTVVAATIEVISAAEIDITHTFVPPERSIYRRALVRAHPVDGPPLLGWIEFNYFRRTE